MKDVEKLWLLQELETEQKTVEEDAGIYREAEAVQNAIAEYKRLTDTMKNIAEEYKRTSITLADTNLALTQNHQQIAEGESHLYEGSVKNSKTLQSLEDELRILQAKKGPLEKTIHHLEHQCKVDRSNLMQLNDKASEMKMAIDAQRKKLEALKKRTQQVLSSVTERMEALKATIDPESLGEYNYRKSKRTPVIVRAKDRVCQGCNMQFSMVIGHSITHVENDDTILCENCGRIIYIPAQEEEIDNL